MASQHASIAPTPIRLDDEARSPRPRRQIAPFASGVHLGRETPTGGAWPCFASLSLGPIIWPTLPMPLLPIMPAIRLPDDPSPIWMPTASLPPEMSPAPKLRSAQLVNIAMPLAKLPVIRIPDDPSPIWLPTAKLPADMSPASRGL